MNGFFTCIARRKIAELVKREDFLNIQSINSEYVSLSFKSNNCKVDIFGNLNWKRDEKI